MGVDNVCGRRDFGKVAGFSLPKGVVEGIFCSLGAEIFEIINCATPAEMQMWPEPRIRDPAVSDDFAVNIRPALVNVHRLEMRRIEFRDTLLKSVQFPGRGTWVTAK